MATIRNNIKSWQSLATALLLLIYAAPAAFAQKKDYRNALEKTAQILKASNVPQKEYLGITQSIDSAMTQGAPDNTWAFNTIYEAGKVFLKSGNMTDAIKLFNNVAAMYENQQELTEEENRFLKNTYLPLGVAHEELGLWNKAMDYYMKCLNLTDKKDTTSYIAMVYNNIGVIYYKQHNLDKAEKYFLQALEINKRTNNKKEMMNNYNNLAGICMIRGDKDKALDYELLAIQNIDHKKDPDLYYFTQCNIAGLYMDRKDYNTAIIYLKNAMTNQQRLDIKPDLLETYRSLAYIYREINRQDSAIYYLNRALSLAKEINNRNKEKQVLSDIAAYYEKKDMFKTAYQNLAEAYMLMDSITNENDKKKMSDIEAVYNMEKENREKELEIKNIALKKATADRRWITTGAIMTILLMIMTLLVTRMKNREKERRRKELINRQKAELYKKEKELQQKEKEELKNILDQRNRELTSHTITMMRNNEFMLGLSDDLKKLMAETGAKDKEMKEHIRQIINKLHKYSPNSEMQEFHYYFEQVHPSFYANITSLYPDLTSKEKRLCAFLQLGLTSKDIASITFKEIRSVESARNRLRKKLADITPDDDLGEFIRNKMSQFGYQNHKINKDSIPLPSSSPLPIDENDDDEDNEKV